jgi:hypothetical protein
MRTNFVKTFGSVALSCLSVSSMTLFIVGVAWAGPILSTTDDAYTGNDPNRGPTVTGDRNEATAFFEVRNHSAPRKKLGYVKYDISGVSPSLYATATLSGGFSTTTHDGAGVWNVYGLIDGVTNTDDVADGSFGEANWTEGGLSYSRGLGVDVAVLPETVNDLGLDFAEVTLLGTITLPGDAPFQSNTTNLPLGAFLNADTNGVVTFIFADANFAGTEWRVAARENTADGSADTGGVLLSFVPILIFREVRSFV